MTVIMPPSALDQLSRLNITYPMLFKLTNKNSDRMTHCGVLEFVADEGICYLPHWMMQNLLLEEGGLVQVESVNLQVATYSKFQPQSPDFLDITNPKAVLENALRNFACLTTGDVIAINYNEKIYELRVMETKPDKAVSIIECDMNVDFDAPLGYKEPERPVQHEESIEGEADHSGYAGEMGFRAFSGSGNRLDGKKKGVEPSPSPIKPGDIKRGIPNYEFKLGKITFIRNSRPLVKKVEEGLAHAELHPHSFLTQNWSLLSTMKLEADLSLSLEKDSHCVKREGSLKSKENKRINRNILAYSYWL
ncbi:ubiquitin recognition factor in ER-associated degradation protein 1 isoform X3 [Nannospalax galili]|uniref:ubiquitin recognition factor in ER-associated degradation protein 1 isoform X3 n=1 Tax=Nannospalax galili TaxID=1026970 RepID=UPI00111C5836|nr:ubiquitin recognition factor in ER-associated degradation protein 1 isoform X3 [Nannospalax galili]